VIEKLGELRDGGRGATAGAPPTRTCSRGRLVRAALAKADDRGETKPMEQRTGVTAPATARRALEEKSDTIAASRTLGTRSCEDSSNRRALCETQLQQPTFLELKGAILNSVSRLATSP